MNKLERIIYKAINTNLKRIILSTIGGMAVVIAGSFVDLHLLKRENMSDRNRYLQVENLTNVDQVMDLNLKDYLVMLNNDLETNREPFKVCLDLEGVGMFFDGYKLMHTTQYVKSTIPIVDSFYIRALNVISQTNKNSVDDEYLGRKCTRFNNELKENRLFYSEN